MRERMHGCRIGEIISRDIHSLNRGYGAARRVGDALLKCRELRTHRRLISEPRGHLAHHPRHFRSSLNEPKDIIDEQQDVTMLVVPKIFRHSERTMTDAKTAAWWLVHLAKDHHHVGKHSRRRHITVQFLAFAAALADATKDVDTVVGSDHVVAHLRQQDGFADAGSAEESRFSAALEGHKDVDDFDARFK